MVGGRVCFLFPLFLVLLYPMMELHYYLLLICGVVWVPVRTGSVHAYIKDRQYRQC